MKFKNSSVPAKVIRFMGLVRYLENLKFQAYHVWSKAEAVEKKPEFDRLLAKVDGLAKELSAEYGVPIKSPAC